MFQKLLRMSVQIGNLNHWDGVKVYSSMTGMCVPALWNEDEHVLNDEYVKLVLWWIPLDYPRNNKCLGVDCANAFAWL